jgi:hypothetical protein
MSVNDATSFDAICVKFNKFIVTLPDTVTSPFTLIPFVTTGFDSEVPGGIAVTVVVVLNPKCRTEINEFVATVLVKIIVEPERL